MRYAVIMAGGTGTRLWPLSRTTMPKQLLSVGSGRSLLGLAYDRLLDVVPRDRIFVACGRVHADAVREHLDDLPADNILGEPVGRDTATAIGFAASVLAERDPDAVIAFVTSDHVIEPVAEFTAALATGFDVAESDPPTLVTFGIVPSSPHTGLGYIEKGAPLRPDGSLLAVSTFTEKPDAAAAAGYLASGRYLWNAGTFVWRARTVLAELAAQLPDTADGLRRVAAAWETDRREDVLDEVYPKLAKISIDYAVLEPAARGDGAGARLVVVPIAVDWLDVGSWPALGGTLAADSAGNTYVGVAALVDSAGNIVVSDDPDHLVATVGLRDTIVVHTADVTMVCPKSEAERVKDLVVHVRESHGERYV